MKLDMHDESGIYAFTYRLHVANFAVMPTLSREFLTRASWRLRLSYWGESATWMSMHNGFRFYGSKICRIAAIEASSDPDMNKKVARLTSALVHYNNSLHSHHDIEDHSFFPSLRQKEPGLKAAFDQLDHDHRAVDSYIKQLRKLKNRFDDEQNTGRCREILKEMCDKAVEYVTHINEHLRREENIVIPLLMKHGY